MLEVRPDPADVGRAEGNAAAQVEAVPALTMRGVVLESNERQRADIDRLLAAVGLLDSEHRIEIGSLGGLEKVTVLVAFAGHVAGEGIVTVGPPESGAVVFVKGNHLLGQWLG